MGFQPLEFQPLEFHPLGETVRSIPHVSLVEGEIVLTQERQELFLKRDGPVMIRLSGDVLLDLLNVGIAHGKCGVPRLPGKILTIGERLVNPVRRAAFDLPKDIGHRGFPTERDEEVNVVGHTARGHKLPCRSRRIPPMYGYKRSGRSPARNGARPFVLKIR